MPSPSPINRVLLGKAHVEGIMIGFVPVAGSRMVEGGGFVIPAHGLALHVMLTGGVTPGIPRASMTPPVVGRIPCEGLRTQFRTAQKFLLGRLFANWLASMNAGEFVTCARRL